MLLEQAQGEGRGHARIPVRNPVATACARERTSSLQINALTWVFTVSSEITNRVAIPWFVRPSATRPSTCNSRLESSCGAAEEASGSDVSTAGRRLEAIVSNVELRAW